MMVGGNGACRDGDMRSRDVGVRLLFDCFSVGFGWEIVVRGVVFLLAFCLIIYIYSMVYIGGHWVCLVGGTSRFGVVDIALFTWCFVVVCG